MRKCRFCEQEIGAASVVCEHCGRELIPGRKVEPTAESTPPIATSIARVSVVDIDMPFASMVGFMVKWAIAAIPALLILASITFVITLVFALLGRAVR